MGGTWSERPLIDAIATTCQDQPRRNPNTFTEQIVCLPGLESHHRLTPMPYAIPIPRQQPFGAYHQFHEHSSTIRIINPQLRFNLAISCNFALFKVQERPTCPTHLAFFQVIGCRCSIQANSSRGGCSLFQLLQRQKLRVFLPITVLPYLQENYGDCIVRLILYQNIPFKKL